MSSTKCDIMGEIEQDTNATTTVIHAEETPSLTNLP